MPRQANKTHTQHRQQVGKIQLQIINQLGAMGRLDEAQRTALAARSDDLTGDALEKLLQDECKVPGFPLLVAKARAVGLAPFNVARLRVTPQMGNPPKRGQPTNAVARRLEGGWLPVVVGFVFIVVAESTGTRNGFLQGPDGLVLDGGTDSRINPSNIPHPECCSG